ncbi:MAG: hypothetical protein O3A18_04475 [Planctomycetota bacterium]|jgi:hypothetical protein|nr:hypothetical protein [Planctomycetota bacterium]
MSRSFASRIGDLIARLFPVAGVLLLLLVASRDRQAGTRDAGGREIIRLPRPDAAGLGGDELPVPADMREAADRLTEAAAAADQARGKLEATQQELDRRKDELEQLRLDAEADSRRTRRQLDDARQELETRQAELEKAAAEAEERVASARKEMEELARRQQEAAAQAGIARGLGRGPRVDMAAVPDPRRLRNPAFPRPLDNAAAVAAAGAAGRRREGGDGRGPGVGSTVAGDLLRGQAELTRARGEYAVDAATAAINAETARSLALDNRLRVVETFFESRRLNQINRAFERGAAITPEQAARLAARGVPRRLTRLELDPITGDIGWPRILSDPAYDELSGRIESSFRDRAARGRSLDFVASNRCLQAIDRLQSRLDARSSQYPAGEFGTARTFLDSLRREAVLPPD